MSRLLSGLATPSVPFALWAYRMRHPYCVHGTNRYLPDAIDSCPSTSDNVPAVAKPVTRYPARAHSALRPRTHELLLPLVPCTVGRRVPGNQPGFTTPALFASINRSRWSLSRKGMGTPPTSVQTLPPLPCLRAMMSHRSSRCCG